MTGYESKKAATQDKLNDDDLTIAYQSGYYDGKKAAQEPVAMLFGSLPVYDTTPPQPAQEPVAWLTRDSVDGCWYATAKKVGKDDKPLYTTPPQLAQDEDAIIIQYHEATIKRLEKRIEELMAQPAQEPISWSVVGDGKFGEYELGQVFVDYEATHIYWENRGYELVPVYTTPPPRPWVGLTNDEVNNFAAGCHLGKSVQGAIYEAEAKLKERNA